MLEKNKSKKGVVRLMSDKSVVGGRVMGKKSVMSEKSVVGEMSEKGVVRDEQ